VRRAATIVLLAGLLSACGSAGGGAPDASGIRGTVVAGPQCPVVTEQSPCPDEPVDGAGIEVYRDGILVATGTSDDDGRFEIELEPGTYEVHPVPPSDVGMFAKPVNVTVVDGSFAPVDLVVDTGIR
jgi:hypothetical protein